MILIIILYYSNIFGFPDPFGFDPFSSDPFSTTEPYTSVETTSTVEKHEKCFGIKNTINN